MNESRRRPPGEDQAGWCVREFQPRVPPDEHIIGRREFGREPGRAEARHRAQRLVPVPSDRRAELHPVPDLEHHLLHYRIARIRRPRCQPVALMTASPAVHGTSTCCQQLLGDAGDATRSPRSAARSRRSRTDRSRRDALLASRRPWVVSVDVAACPSVASRRPAARASWRTGATFAPVRSRPPTPM